jgi:hypothetical protein
VLLAFVDHEDVEENAVQNHQSDQHEEKARQQPDVPPRRGCLEEKRQL